MTELEFHSETFATAFLGQADNSNPQFDDLVQARILWTWANPVAVTQSEFAADTLTGFSGAVSVERTVEYDEDSNLPVVETTTWEDESRTTITTRAFEVYPSMQDEMQLTQVARVDLTDGSDTFAATISRWSQELTGINRFFPTDVWRWDEVDPGTSPAFTWWTSTVPTAQPWSVAGTISEYDVNGRPVSLLAASGTEQAILYDSDGNWPIAVVQNADVSDVVFDDFSPIGGNVTWTGGSSFSVSQTGTLKQDDDLFGSSEVIGSGNSVSLASATVEARVHLAQTGGVSASNLAGIQFRQSSAAHSFQTSGYAFLINGTGGAELRKGGSTIASCAVSGESGPFQFLRVTLTDTEIKGEVNGHLCFVVTDGTYSGWYAGLYAAGGFVEFDDFGIFPTDALVRLAAYDERGNVVSARTEDGNVNTYAYDSFGRLVYIRNGAKEPLSIAQYYSSTASNNGFDAEDPDYVREISFSQASLLYDWSAETTTGTDPSSWDFIKSGTAVAALDSTYSHHGRRSLRASKGSTSDYVHWRAEDGFEIDEDEAYAIVFAVKRGSNYTGGAQVRIRLSDIGGSTTQEEVISIPVASSTDWELMSRLIVPAAGSVELKELELQWPNYTGSGDIWYDAIYFAGPVNVTTSYSDGLARVLQTHLGHVTPTVEVVEYDDAGLEHKAWNAYRAAGPGYDPSYATAAEAEYLGKTGATRPFVEKTYHDDPRALVETVRAAGFSQVEDGLQNEQFVELVGESVFSVSQQVDERQTLSRVLIDGFGQERFRKEAVEGTVGTMVSHELVSGSLGTVTSNPFTVPTTQTVSFTCELYSVHPYDTTCQIRRISNGDILGDAISVHGNPVLVADESYGELIQGVQYELRIIVSGGAPEDSKITVYVSTPQSDALAKTQFVYDAVGNTVEARPPNYFDPPTGTAANWRTVYRYDRLGRLVGKTTPDADGDGDGVSSDETGLVGSEDYRYKYDQANRLRFVDDPDVGDDFNFFEYDANSRIIAAGLCYQYDWSNADPDEISTECDAPLKEYAYEGSRLVRASMKDVVGSQFVYDGHGRLKEHLITLDGLHTKRIRYDYDLQGRVVHIAYQPDSTDSFYHWYTYNNLGQLVEVESSRQSTRATAASDVKLEYDARGKVVESLFATGMEDVDYDYNIRGGLPPYFRTG